MALGAITRHQHDVLVTAWVQMHSFKGTPHWERFWLLAYQLVNDKKIWTANVPKSTLETGDKLDKPQYFMTYGWFL